MRKLGNIEAVAEDYKAGLSIEKITKKHKISAPTLYRYLRSVNIPERKTAWNIRTGGIKDGNGSKK
jgi:transposase